jgi:FkbM family methyltransferase
MTHIRVHPHPKMTRFLVDQLQAFKDDPIVILDVGARGGTESYWQLYGDQAFQIGFEADVEECQKLNQEYSGKNYRFYPIALGKQRETRTFSICQSLTGSSFYPANMDFLNRFPAYHAQAMEVVKTASIETIDLDSFARAEPIREADFIKLDVEGSELDVLQGATSLLQRSVLGLRLEVLFHSDLRSQPTFSEIDLFLNSLGFKLFDLKMYRYARKTLSLPPGLFDSTAIGQVLWGEALYLRDGVSEMKANSSGMDWSQNKILKLASLMEIFYLIDCAIELIQAGANSLTYSSQELIDLLMPN